MPKWLTPTPLVHHPLWSYNDSVADETQQIWHGDYLGTQWKSVICPANIHSSWVLVYSNHSSQLLCPLQATKRKRGFTYNHNTSLVFPLQNTHRHCKIIWSTSWVWPSPPLSNSLSILWNWPKSHEVPRALCRLSPSWQTCNVLWTRSPTIIFSLWGEPARASVLW